MWEKNQKPKNYAKMGRNGWPAYTPEAEKLIKEGIPKHPNRGGT